MISLSPNMNGNLKIINTLGLGAAFFALLGLFGWFLRNHISVEKDGWHEITTEIRGLTTEVQKSNFYLADHLSRTDQGRTR